MNMVFGTNMFHEESSICLAAQFVGLKSSDPIGVRVLKGSDSYEGGNKNGIVSNKAFKSLLSLTFDQTIVEPPIEYSKNEIVEVVDGKNCFVRGQ